MAKHKRKHTVHNIPPQDPGHIEEPRGPRVITSAFVAILEITPHVPHKILVHVDHGPDMSELTNDDLARLKVELSMVYSSIETKKLLSDANTGNPKDDCFG